MGCIGQLSTAVTKCLRQPTYKEEMLIFAHRLGGFCLGSVGSIADVCISGRGSCPQCSGEAKRERERRRG